MPKRYSQEEENTLLCSQLYQLEKQSELHIGTVKLIGDLLPGVVLINDMVNLENTYMNKVGCDFLAKSQEEITSLGATYFGDEIFCLDELAYIMPHFKALAERNDLTEITDLYLKVRRNRNSNWKQYYLSGKILKENSNCFIYLGLEIEKRRVGISKIGSLLETAPIDPVIFQRFNSLTKREKEVLVLIASGCANKQIADMLFVSIYTIETHRKNINTKLNTKSLAELIKIADLFNLNP